MDFDKIAQSLPLLGGKENIASAAHCHRLRLVLVDDTLADQHAIGQIDGVKGCFVIQGKCKSSLARG